MSVSCFKRLGVLVSFFILVGCVAFVWRPFDSNLTARRPTAKPVQPILRPAEYGKKAQEPPSSGNQPEAAEPGMRFYRKSGEEPAWAVRYGAEFWRKGSAEPDQPNVPFNIATLVDRVRHAFEPGPAPRVQLPGDAFAVELDKNGIRFYPGEPDRKKQPSDTETALELQTAAVRIGSHPIYQQANSELPWSINGNVAQALLSPGLVEHFEVTREGVASTWVLQSKPDVAGDMEIEWRTSGLTLDVQTETGWHFLDREGKSRVRIGAATAVDANGNATSLQTTARDGSLIIRVPRPIIENAGYPLAIDPIVSAEFEMDAPAVASAVGDQLGPELAWNGSKWLVVWDDWRINRSIYGVVVDTDGELSPTRGLPIAPNKATAGSLAVASNNAGDWLVVWEEYGVENNHLYGSLISSAGEISSPGGGVLMGSPEKTQRDCALASVGANWLLVYSSFTLDNAPLFLGTIVNGAGVPQQINGFTISTEDSFEPVVSVNGGSYYVAWKSFYTIRGSIVTANGSVGTVGGREIATTGFLHSMQLAQNGNGWVAAWSEDRYLGTGDDIYVRKIGVDGSLGAEAAVVKVSGQQADFSLSSNGTDCYIAWVDRRNEGSSDLYGTLINSSGTVASPNGMLICNAPGRQEAVELASDGSQWIVVWIDYRTATGEVNTSIYGSLIAPSGAVLQTNGFPVCSYRYISASKPFVDGGNGAGWLVGWQDIRTHYASQIDLYATRVSSNGIVQDPLGSSITLSANNETNISIASNGTSWFAAWEDDRNSPMPDIYGMLVGVDGVPLSTEGIPICTAAGWQTGVRVAASGSNYFAAWRDDRPPEERGVYGAVINENGDVLHSNGFRVTDRYSSEVRTAGNGVDFLVGWESQSKLYAARVTPSASVSPTSLAEPINNSWRWDLTSGGGDWLLIWNYAHPTTDLDILGAIVDGSGSLRGSPFIISNAPGDQTFPVACFHEAKYCVAWVDMRLGPSTQDPVTTTMNIYSSWLSPIGVITNPDIPVCTAKGDQLALSISANISGALLVWQDHREAVRYTSSQPDIYGAILTSDGSVHAPVNGFPIANTLNYETYPRVSGEGTRWLVNWQELNQSRFAKILGDGSIAAVPVADSPGEGYAFVSQPIYNSSAAAFLVGSIGIGYGIPGSWSGPRRAVGQTIRFGIEQSINFDDIPDQPFTSTPIPLSAVSSSGLPVSFTVVSGPASISDNQLILKSAGTVVVRVSQSGDETFEPAPSLQQTFVFSKLPQTVTFAAIPDQNFSSMPLALSAKSTVGLPIVFRVVAGPAAVIGNQVTMLGLGSVTVTATAGNGIYQSVSASRMFAVYDATLPLITAKSKIRTGSGKTKLRGVVVDNHNPAKVKYRIKPPGGSYGGLKTKSLGGMSPEKTFSLSIPTAAEGKYSVELIPIDTAGNTGPKKRVTIVR